MYRVAVLVVAACAGRSTGGPIVHNTSARQDSSVLGRPWISLESLDHVELSTPRDAVVPDRPCPLAIRRTLGDARVVDCGRLDNEKLQFDDTGVAQLDAARACVAEALAAREPFVAMWHSVGADPICDDRGIRTTCGSQDHERIWVLAGVLGRDGYATYRIKATEDTFSDPTLPGQTPIVTRASSTTSVRCGKIIVEPPAQCEESHDVPSCFTCEEPVEVNRCQRGS